MFKKQAGLSTPALLMVLIACAGVLLVVFTIGPLYIDNYFVKASVESLEDEDVRRMSDRQIRGTLGRYFTINGVRDISAQSAKIERSAKHVIVKVDYEKRVNLIGNLDVVTRFENHYDTRDR